MLFSCVVRFGIYLISQNFIRRIVDCHSRVCTPSCSCPGFMVFIKTLSFAVFSWIHGGQTDVRANIQI